MSGYPLPEAGEMQRRVVVRLWVDVPVGMTGVQQDFSSVPPVALWAKVEPVHSLAIRYGAQVAEVPTHIFWVRYQAFKPEQLTAQHVIEWQGHRYRVLGALDANNAQRFTRVECKDLGVIRV